MGGGREEQLSKIHPQSSHNPISKKKAKYPPTSAPSWQQTPLQAAIPFPAETTIPQTLAFSLTSPRSHVKKLKAALLPVKKGKDTFWAENYELIWRSALFYWCVCYNLPELVSSSIMVSNNMVSNHHLKLFIFLNSNFKMNKYLSKFIF